MQAPYSSTMDGCCAHVFQQYGMADPWSVDLKHTGINVHGSERLQAGAVRSCMHHTLCMQSQSPMQACTSAPVSCLRPLFPAQRS